MPRHGKPFDCMVAWAEGNCEAVISPAVLADYHEAIEELRAEYPDRTPVEWADALPNPLFSFSRQTA